MPSFPEYNSKTRNQQLDEFYLKKLQIKQAIADQKKNTFDNYITKHLPFKLCNN